MSSRRTRYKRIIKIYINVLNHRTIISILFAILATWISYKYNFIFNLDLTIISVAVIFPLVFTLGSAFQRREKALEHLGRAKGALAAINYCFSFSSKIEVSEREKVYKEVKKVKEELIEFLYSDSNDKSALNSSVAKIQEFIILHRENIGRSLSLKIYRLMRDVIMGIENTISIKTHRTPYSIRAYCKVFIYVFPFFYAPSLIKNIQYPNLMVEEIVNNQTFSLDNNFVFIVYGLNIIISFLLITLFNVQEQIENPFDQNGMDDIILENYLIDY
jgi:hypothetical protein